MITLIDIKQSYQRINLFIKRTPLIEIQKDIFLKLENKQPVVNGFKIRGAASFMTKLPKKTKKVVTSALGTHGFAVGHLGKKLGIRTVCVMPRNSSPTSVKKIKLLVDQVIFMENQFVKTEQAAKRWADQQGWPFIHPYNDPLVIAGQGTIGLEIIEQLPAVKNIYVPIGGGGMISGIAIALKAINPKIRIVGVQPKNMHAMITSIKRKRIVQVKEASSLAEKLAINLNPKTITYPIVKKYVDEFIQPSEEEIKKAMRLIYHKTGNVAEGAGAIAYAAALKDKKRVGKSVCILSGGNINNQKFKELIK